MEAFRRSAQHEDSAVEHCSFPTEYTWAEKQTLKIRDVAKLRRSFKDKCKYKPTPTAITYLFYEGRNEFLRYTKCKSAKGLK